MTGVLVVWRRACVAASIALIAACTPKRNEPPTVSQEQAGLLVSHDRHARIALTTGVPAARVSATGSWEIAEQGGKQLLVRGAGGEGWRVEQRGRLLRVAGDGEDATPWRVGPFVARAAANGFVSYADKRFRGELWFSVGDSGVRVVNRVLVEEYLRGVVPLEIGSRQESDRAALEAQAIAARSYAYVRVPSDAAPPSAAEYHMVATTNNQVYGGVDAENPVVDEAIASTAGLVLSYNGFLVDAPYSSSCGGRSATPRDVWRDGRDQPYLPSVLDLNLATGQPFCDINPRNHWVEELNAIEVSAAVKRALELQGAPQVPSALPRNITVSERAPSGRVTTLMIETPGARVAIPARDVRTVLRDARGAILPSLYFSVERVASADGQLDGVRLLGNGNGHGVGMCQWGAIGRARAGQDFRAILRHYYPGTVLGYVD